MDLSTRVALTLLLVLSVQPFVAAQISFDDVGALRGIDPYVMAAPGRGGCSAVDYDNDGDIDLFVPNGAGVADQLYENDGSGTFNDVASSAGVASTASHRGSLFFDADGDGWLDLLTWGDCNDAACGSVILYHQSTPGQFVAVVDPDIANLLPVNPTVVFGGAAAGDLDNDHDLDLIIVSWGNFGGYRILRNDGEMDFVDITDTAGFDIPFGANPWQPLMVDLDDDGRLDVYVSVDFGANQYWRNHGDWEFTNEAQARNLDNFMNDMGVAIGDYDNDGDFDFYVTNIDVPAGGFHSVLLNNDGGTFTEQAGSAGVATSFFAWGTTFLDADNDGDLDLAATNGFPGFPWFEDPSRFYMNNGLGTFNEVSTAVGFDDQELASCLLAADLNRDGTLDMVQACFEGPLRILDNNSSLSPGLANYLVVRPRSSGPNTRGIGCRVEIRAPDVQVRLITAGTSFMGQEPAEATFGLGSRPDVDDVRVRWPDGSTSIVQNVGANRVIDVFHAGPGDLDGDGAFTEVDTFLFLQCLDLGREADGPPGFGLSCRAADLDNDDDVDCDDWTVFEATFITATGGAPDLDTIVDCNEDGIPDACNLESGDTDCNGNGILDACDIAASTSSDADLDGLPDECTQFIRGDANADGDVDVADVIAILGHAFLSEVVACRVACDVDDDGAIQINDPVWLLGYLFSATAPPTSPWPNCGVDPTWDAALDCSLTSCP